MQYNFDETVVRRGTSCVKWDETDRGDIVPLWVADMDFRAYPAITDALRRRVEHGVFGYTHVPPSYYDSVIRWYTGRHHVLPFRRDDIIVTTGVVPAISAIIRALTLPGDKVVAMTPVYNCFFSCIRNQGCQMEASPLVYEDGTYHVDWDDFERRCADPKTRLFLLCNPHNPAGRVWTRQELQRMSDICLRHGVFVVADEIHCEIIMPGHDFVSFASLSAEAQHNCALCVAASKAFNVAGLQTANIIVTDSERRERIDRAINLHEICDVNPFGIIAAEAAFTEGGAEWLRQLNEYIWGNYQLLVQTLGEKLPSCPVLKLEGTYLAWVDCQSIGRPSAEIAQTLLDDYGVWVNDGEMYGATERPFLRINLACPRSQLSEGLSRLVRGLQ